MAGIFFASIFVFGINTYYENHPLSDGIRDKIVIFRGFQKKQNKN